MIFNHELHELTMHVNPTCRAKRSTEKEAEAMKEEAVELVQEGLVTVAEAARFTGLSRSSLYTLMETGRLVYAKIGRARRIPRRALIELAASSLRGGWGR